MSNWDRFERFNPDEVGRASNSPGLYAWYGVMVAGPPDWQMNIEQGTDHGEENSRKLLRSYTARHHGPELEIQATGGFSTVWQGQINDSSNLDLQDVLAAPLNNAEADGNVPAPKLQRTLSSPNARKLLFKALQASSPIFASPLYIGVAENLSKRLEQHAKMLFKLWHVYSNDPAKFEKVLDSQRFKGQFAVRAVQRGFSPDTVEVWTLPLEHLNEDGLTHEDLRVVAEATEWLLNRWHRPPLGRR